MPGAAKIVATSREVYRGSVTGKGKAAHGLEDGRHLILIRDLVLATPTPTTTETCRVIAGSLVVSMSVCGHPITTKTTSKVVSRRAAQVPPSFAGSGLENCCNCREGQQVGRAIPENSPSLSSD